MSFRINGHVLSRGTKQGIAGLRVEARDNALFFDDLVGSAVTGADDSFHVRGDAEGR